MAHCQFWQEGEESSCFRLDKAWRDCLFNKYSHFVDKCFVNSLFHFPPSVKQCPQNNSHFVTCQIMVYCYCLETCHLNAWLGLVVCSSFLMGSVMFSSRLSDISTHKKSEFVL